MTTNAPAPVNALELAARGHGFGAAQSLVARLNIYTESVIYTRFEQGKPVTTYEVDPADVAGVLSGIPINSGLLPRDVIHYGRSGGVESITILLPAATRTLRAPTAKGLEVAEYVVTTPPLVWQGRGANYYLYALKPGGEWPHAESHLFRAPFPNVNAEGRVCRGSVAFPLATTRTIHAAAELFFKSDFNRSLADGSSRQYPKNVVGMWPKAVEAYPLDDLMPAGLSLGRFLDEGGR